MADRIVKKMTLAFDIGVHTKMTRAACILNIPMIKFITMAIDEASDKVIKEGRLPNRPQLKQVATNKGFNPTPQHPIHKINPLDPMDLNSPKF